MQRLADGAIALFSQSGAYVRTLVDENVRVDIEAGLRDALVRLARGLPDEREGDDDDRALFALLTRAGLAGRGLPSDDPVVLAHLAELGRGFAWRLDDDTRARADELRRVHARRKSSFLDFWQGPCVPECGGLRLARILDAVAPGSRIFLVGDDDLLSIPLARAGLLVTTIDIDDTLIALLHAFADEESLPLDARVQDLCEPMPADLIATFDAALTDPQSSPAPMRAFASRALAALKPTGTLFISVHDQFRHGFSALSRELPARPVRAHLGFGAYYTHGYEPDPYRSDFIVLDRCPGEPPHAATERIPADVFQGGDAAATDHHGLGDARVMTLKREAWLDVDALARALEASPHADVLSVQVTCFDGGALVLAPLTGGGHLSVRIDFPRKLVSWEIAPLTRGLEEALLHALEQQVRLIRHDGLRGVPPHVDAPSYLFTLSR